MQEKAMSDAGNLEAGQVTVVAGDQPDRKIDVYYRDGQLFAVASDLESVLSCRITWDEDGEGVSLESAPVGPKPEIPSEILAAIDAAAGRLREIGRLIYENPERGDTEFQAAAWLTAELGKHGFAVQKGLSGIRPLSGEPVHLATAFKAVMEGSGPGPTIGIMLEYDALPMGHGCGHNLIAVAGLGAAIGLARLMPELPGRLVVYGTPAEDGGALGGKIPMLGAGHFTGVDIALITHGGDRWDTGSLWLGTKGVKCTFRGTPAHAAGAPHLGRSALDAVVLLFTGVEMMREHVRPDTRLHGIITNGGTVSNIVPEEAAASFGVRSLDKDYLQELGVWVENVAKGAALATGCTVEMEWSYGYSPTVNVPALDELVLKNAGRLGAAPVKKWTALASSDLGNVGQVIPTVNLWFGVAPEGVELHTKEFLAASGSPAGLDGAILAAKTVAVSAAQLFRCPETVQRIKQEFANRNQDGK